MDAQGGGRVLMTYLQWRSSDGLARPSKNSCEIQQNNRRVVGERWRGSGGVDLRQLRLCIRMAGSVWSERPPYSPSTSPPSAPPQHPGERGREEVLSGPCSQSLVLFLNTKCGRGPEKWVVFVLSSVPWQNTGYVAPLPIQPNPPCTNLHTHTLAGEPVQRKDLLAWPANKLYINTKTSPYAHTWYRV